MCVDGKDPDLACNSGTGTKIAHNNLKHISVSTILKSDKIFGAFLWPFW